MKAKKLKSGLWSVRVFVGRDENGKTKHRTVTGETKTEALRKAALCYAPSDSMTVGEACERFLSVRGPESNLSIMCKNRCATTIFSFRFATKCNNHEKCTTDAQLFYQFYAMLSTEKSPALTGALKGDKPRSLTFTVGGLNLEKFSADPPGFSVILRLKPGCQKDSSFFARQKNFRSLLDGGYL